MLEHISVGCSPIRSAACYLVEQEPKVVYSAGNNIIISDLYEPLKRRLLSGPRDTINAICLSGEYVISACNDASLYFHNMNTGDLRKTIALEAPLQYVDAFSDSILAGSIDGVVYWIQEQRIVSKIQLKERITELKILSVDCTRNSNYLALVATSDSKVKIFRLGQQITQLDFSLEGHSNWVSGISISNNRIATSSHDKTIRIWELAQASSTKCELQEFVAMNNSFKLESVEYSIDLEAIILGHEDLIHSVYFDREAERLVSTSGDGCVMIWERIEGIWQSVQQLGHPCSAGGPLASDLFDGVIFEANSQLNVLAHSCTGSFLHWIDAKLQPICISGHVERVEDLSWSPNGQLLASVSADRTTRIFHENREVARAQIHGYELLSIAFINEGEFVSAGDEKVIRRFKAPWTFRKRLGMPLDEKNENDHGKVTLPVLGLSNKTEKTSGPEPLANGTDANDGKVTEVNLCRDTLWQEVDKLYSHGDELYTLAVSGDLMASAAKASLTGDSAVRLWKLNADNTISLLKKLALHQLTVVQLAFSPDGQKLLSVSRDRTAVVYDLAADRIVRTVREHRRIIWSGVWLDSEHFATGSRDGTVRLWALGSEEELERFEYGRAVTAVAYAAGTMLVGLEDGGLVGYCFREGRLAEERAMKVQTAAISRIAFNPADASLVATASHDHSVCLFRLQNPIND